MTRVPGSEERRGRWAGEVARFVRDYGRKARQGGLDSNDRQYDRGIEARIKRLAPEELDRLLREEDG